MLACVSLCLSVMDINILIVIGALFKLMSIQFYLLIGKYMPWLHVELHLYLHLCMGRCALRVGMLRKCICVSFGVTAQLLAWNNSGGWSGRPVWCNLFGWIHWIGGIDWMSHCKKQSTPGLGFTTLQNSSKLCNCIYLHIFAYQPATTLQIFMGKARQGWVR